MAASYIYLCSYSLFNYLNISVSTLINKEIKAYQNNSAHIIEILHSPLSINSL